MIEKLKGFLKGVFSDTKKTVVAILVVFIIVVLLSGLVSTVKEHKLRQEAIERGEVQNSTESMETTESEDAYLIQIQDSLVQSYGTLPKGYIWDVDGTLLSLGDKSMSAEDVVYSYLNGLRSLDLSMAQKYSRRSTVVQTYEGYFDSNKPTSDYYDSFIRNMYKEVLLSIEPGGIIDSTVFAENKQVFTVKLNVLDLTSKDFWIQDKETIYNNLYIYSNDEGDSAKSDMYLYDYVLNYYRSPDAIKRDVTVNITVEKYPDLDTGWLVAIDDDINSICNYSDGNLIVNYIRRMFSEEGREMVQTGREESSTEAVSEESMEN